jgi:hypothetical protein
VNSSISPESASEAFIAPKTSFGSPFETAGTGLASREGTPNRIIAIKHTNCLNHGRIFYPPKPNTRELIAEKTILYSQSICRVSKNAFKNL